MFSDPFMLLNSVFFSFGTVSLNADNIELYMDSMDSRYQELSVHNVKQSPIRVMVLGIKLELYVERLIGNYKEYICEKSLSVYWLMLAISTEILTVLVEPYSWQIWKQVGQVG